MADKPGGIGLKSGMLVRFALLCLALGCTTALGAGSSLIKEEIAKAVKSDSVTIPTPGELLIALNKIGKPNWQQQYRQPIPTAYTSRPQIALNLGGMIADGYIAVQAEDSQQVKNIGRDIVTLAKALGVSENVLRRGKSIADFSENNEWGTLKEELEATQNEIKLAMEEQHDEELVTLVTLGGWIRGTEAVAAWISDNYTPSAAKLLRQPAVVAFFRSKLDALPEKAQNDPLVHEVHAKLVEIERLLSFPREKAPGIEDVKALKAAAASLVKEISVKK
jgi:hypothetical protein